MPHIEPPFTLTDLRYDWQDNKLALIYANSTYVMWTENQFINNVYSSCSHGSHETYDNIDIQRKYHTSKM